LENLFNEKPIRTFSELAKAVLDEPTPNNFVAHIAMRILEPLECRGAILGVIQNEGFLDLIATYGYSEETTTNFRRMPLWTPTPITDAARTGKISIFKSPAEMVARYPALAPTIQSDEGIIVSAPIKYRNTVIGAAGFTSLRAPVDGFETNSTTDAILALCGIYLRNFLLNKSPVEIDHSISAKALTSRQKQIIALFREELTTDQMADRLKYSSSTINRIPSRFTVFLA
jgi:hypothetical protein